MTRIHQVYFLRRHDNLIKIGTTTDFPTRLAALTSSHGLLDVLRLINGGRKRELELHHQFKRFHEYGEWFRSERGALGALIDQLEVGAEIQVGQTEAKTAWDIGEADLMATVRRKIDLMTKARMDRTLLNRPAAIAAITADYGFSEWFLWYARKRGSTVSAYGYQRICDAYLSEMRDLLARLNAEISVIAAEDQAADRLRAIASEIEERRAVK
jgi:hypothetical protein